MPIYEIASTTVSQGYLDDSTILNPALDWLSRRPGFIKQWLGLQIENGTTLHHVIEWETYEHLQAVDSDPDFSQFLELIKPSVEGPPKVYVVDFDNAADATLDAPITEFCFARVKDATKNADLIDLLVRLGKELTAHPGCHGPAPSGPTTQESGTQVIIIGWDTVQTHVDAVTNNPGVATLVSLADLEVTHSALKKHSLP